MSARWKLTVRSGPRVERAAFPQLPDALASLEERARELAETAPRRALDTKVKRFEPEQQVVARLELSGPQRLVASVRAGVDVRGDGSVEAYRGRVRRRPITPERDETPYAALARELT
ncbi:MAG: hypothetical protein ABI323_03155 [Solirubrobacteraceae bacterium]